MSDVYKNCPTFESNRFLLRFSQLDDAGDLVSVYSDKNSLPFFNSDNCHGDNFYYPTEERMREAIKFWLSSYSTKWFVRWTIMLAMLLTGEPFSNPSSSTTMQRPSGRYLG